MVDFNKALQLSNTANKYVNQLKAEDNMCKIADIIDEMDMETLKMVLKKFVYAQ